MNVARLRAGLKRALSVAGRRARADVRVTLAAVVLGSVAAGAAVGAGTHPQSPSYRAEAVVKVQVPAGVSQSSAWHTVGEVLSLGTVRARIARQVGDEGATPRVGTAGDPQGSIISVFGIGSTRALAQALANTAAQVALSFLSQSVARSSVSNFSFDHSSEGWDLGNGLYVLPPGRAAQSAARAHTGAGSLQAVCASSVIGGCGPFIRLERAFLRGSLYASQGWVNATAGTRLRLVLGSTPYDVAVGATVSATGRWQKLVTSWIPRRGAESAVLTFQVMSRGTARLNIDDVAVGTQAAVQRGETAPARSARYETILPAATTTTLHRVHTVRWAIGGGLAGLLVGLAAAAAALAAARRRRPSAPASDHPADQSSPDGR